MAPSELEHSLSNLHEDNEKLLVGLDSSDDASVYKLGKKALVQTLDFITPIVDDPYLYGQIAAANSLSDIFAMNAKVITALNIVGYDNCNLNKEILKEILQGGFSKIKESGGLLTGGHTIQSGEMFYGLSVTGMTKCKKIWQNNTSKEGDVLILTKPLGSGIISTAIKGGIASKDDEKEIGSSMSRLNIYAQKALKSLKVNACTDISGFGLLGHVKEMLNENISIVLHYNDIPVFSNAQKYADMGLIPEGSYKNYEFAKSLVDGEVNPIFCDAQTSGGLLISVSQKNAKKALKQIQESGDELAKIIGFVEKREDKSIKIL